LEIGTLNPKKRLIFSISKRKTNSSFRVQWWVGAGSLWPEDSSKREKEREREKVSVCALSIVHCVRPPFSQAKVHMKAGLLGQV
jgi:hypothetical protein